MSCYKVGSERECPVCHQPKIRERSARVCSACARSVFSRGPVVATEEEAQVADSYPDSFDTKYEMFCNWIGRSDTCVPPPAFEDRQHDIIHLADCHVPYCDLDALRGIVALTRGAGTCVVGGDFFNAGAFSRFVDGDKISPREELTAAQTVLQFLAENYQRVIVRKGNHPDRIRKYFAARIPPEMMFLVTTDILPILVAGLPNVEVAQPIRSEFPNSDWITVVGDCAFTHGETHSVVEGRPVVNVDKWLRMWADHLPTNISTVVQEHNHAALKMPSRDGQRLLIMTPALSLNVSYQWDASMKWKPNHVGYTRVVQDSSGKTDWNNSGFVLWNGGRKAEKCA